MTNEQYLYVSYFGAAAGGVGLAVVTALFLARGHREATDQPLVARLGRLLRRIFPLWLLAAVLLGFMSVSYMQCKTYEEVVADRGYLIDKTQEQVHHMCLFLAVAPAVYGLVLMLFLWARAIVRRHHNCKRVS